MAILRSVDGRFYEVPDDQLNQYLIPEDKVKEKLEGSGAPMVAPNAPPPDAGPGPAGGSPTIVVQVYGAAPPPGAGAPPPSSGTEAPAGAEVQPYGWWNNWWHNVRPGWNNWWHNWHR
jgi:hypothetical protein